MPKILPISVTPKNLIAMVCRSAWRTACSWSALLVACSALVVKPLKDRKGERSDQGLSVTLVTLIPDPLRASAGPCLLVVAPIFLKFYRNILWLIVFKKQ